MKSGLAMTERECHCERSECGAWQSLGDGATLVVIYLSPYEKANQGADEHHYCDYDNNECP
jgi:hypothetical protein